MHVLEVGTYKGLVRGEMKKSQQAADACWLFERVEESDSPRRV